MTCSPTALSCLPDSALLSTVQSLAGRERFATVELVAALAELDARRLYLEQGCSSLFAYCTQVLHLGTSNRPFARPRHIPAAVRRIVWTRDEGRCAFVGALGRCTAHAFLEFHHVKPVAHGGQAQPENVELHCRAHNQHEADQYFWAEAQA